MDILFFRISTDHRSSEPTFLHVANAFRPVMDTSLNRKEDWTPIEHYEEDLSLDSGVDVGSFNEKELLSKAEQNYFETLLGIECSGGGISGRFLERSPLNFEPFPQARRGMTKENLSEGGRATFAGEGSEGLTDSRHNVWVGSLDHCRELPNLSLFAELDSRYFDFLNSLSSSGESCSCYCSEIEYFQNLDVHSSSASPSEKINPPQQPSTTTMDWKRRFDKPNFLSRVIALLSSLVPKVAFGIPLAEEAGRKLPNTSADGEPLSLQEELDAVVATPSLSSSPQRPLTSSCFEKLLHQWLKTNSGEGCSENTAILSSPDKHFHRSQGHGHTCSGIEELSAMAEELRRKKNKITK